MTETEIRAEEGGAEKWEGDQSLVAVTCWPVRSENGSRQEQKEKEEEAPITESVDFFFTLSL